MWWNAAKHWLRCWVASVNTRWVQKRVRCLRMCRDIFNCQGNTVPQHSHRSGHQRKNWSTLPDYRRARHGSLQLTSYHCSHVGGEWLRESAAEIQTCIFGRAKRWVGVVHTLLHMSDICHATYMCVWSECLVFSAICLVDLASALVSVCLFSRFSATDDVQFCLVIGSVWLCIVITPFSPQTKAIVPTLS